MSNKHLILPVVALAMLGARADAGFWTFSGPIEGSQEVPPTGSTVVGFVSGDYNDVTNVMNILAYPDGFTTAVLDSHIHGPAAPGTNAGILIGLGAGGGFGYDYYKAMQFTLTPIQESYFLSGMTYINVHT
jgi:hypothetical protein